jgi:hypothetical protein
LSPGNPAQIGVFQLLLQVNTSVTSVNLGNNNIGVEGGKAMVEMLKVRTYMLAACFVLVSRLVPRCSHPVLEA